MTHFSSPSFLATSGWQESGIQFVVHIYFPLMESAGPPSSVLPLKTWHGQPSLCEEKQQKQESHPASQMGSYPYRLSAMELKTAPSAYNAITKGKEHTAF